MKREILINANPRETRVAIIEDDQLVELLVDRPEARRRTHASTVRPQALLHRAQEHAQRRALEVGVVVQEVT